MRIAFVYDKGRPPGWARRAFEGAALGGSEGSMIHYAEEFAKLGHEVTILTPDAPDQEFNGVYWHDLKGIHGREFDVAIALRFADSLVSVRAPLRVLYCTDPEIPDLPEHVEAGYVNLVITISQHQKERFQRQHPIREEFYFVSNAGIVYSDYLNKDVKKVRGRCIYCSAPPRGLLPLVHAWPLIREKVPYATLHVTGGLELWGFNIPLEQQPVLQMLLKLEGATYLGVIPREDLVKEQLESEVLLLPGRTDSPEMCCISAMECQAAGVFPVVGDIAALPERVVDTGVGYICPVGRESVYRRPFVDWATAALVGRGKQIEHQLKQASKFVGKYDYSVLAPQWIARFEETLDAQG